MAIFRKGIKIGGYDIRVGFPRDRSYDNIDKDPRLKQKANPDTTINRFRSMISGAEGLYRPAKFLVGLEFPKTLTGDIASNEFTEYTLDRDFLTQTRTSIKDRLYFLNLNMWTQFFNLYTKFFQR